MSAKKNSSVKLSEDLQKALDAVVSSATAKGGSVTEDDIQLAVRDIDVDGDELSDLYDSIRAHGVEITTSGDGDLSPELMAAIGQDDVDDDFPAELDDEEGEEEIVSEKIYDEEEE